MTKRQRSHDMVQRAIYRMRQKDDARKKYFDGIDNEDEIGRKKKRRINRGAEK